MKMWMMVYLQGLSEVQIDNLDDWALGLWFDFSIEYDLNNFREKRFLERIEESKKELPDENVMKELGY